MNKQYIVEPVVEDNVWTVHKSVGKFVSGNESASQAIIILLLCGEMKISIEDGKDYFLKDEEMILIPAGVCFQLIVSENSHYFKCKIQLNSQLFTNCPLLNELIHSSVENENSIKEDYHILPINKTIRNFLSLTEMYIEEKINSDNLFNLKKYELFHHLCYSYKKEEWVNFLKRACLTANYNLS